MCIPCSLPSPVRRGLHEGGHAILVAHVEAWTKELLDEDDADLNLAALLRCGGALTRIADRSWCRVTASLRHLGIWFVDVPQCGCTTGDLDNRSSARLVIQSTREVINIPNYGKAGSRAAIGYSEGIAAKQIHASDLREPTEWLPNKESATGHVCFVLHGTD